MIKGRVNHPEQHDGEGGEGGDHVFKEEGGVLLEEEGEEDDEDVTEVCPFLCIHPSFSRGSEGNVL